MLLTEDYLMDNTNGFCLKHFSADLLSSLDHPHQPKETQEIKSLKESFKDMMTSLFSEQDNLGDSFVEERISALEKVYGGRQRFYEKFLIARKYNLGKAEKMMNNMLQKRYDIIGKNLVTSASNPESQTANEKELFERISNHWPFECVGYSKHGNLILRAKLSSMDPVEFLKLFTIQEIQRYYFYFVEKCNILLRVSNSSPFSDFENKNLPSNSSSYESKRMIEIYDFKGCKRKQFCLSSLKVLKEILAIGEVVFPEQVEKTMMINSPWFFKFMFSVVSVVMSKDTKAKITVTKDSNRAEIINLVGSESLLKVLF